MPDNNFASLSFSISPVQFEEALRAVCVQATSSASLAHLEYGRSSETFLRIYILDLPFPRHAALQPS